MWNPVQCSCLSRLQLKVWAPEQHRPPLCYLYWWSVFYLEWVCPPFCLLPMPTLPSRLSFKRHNLLQKASDPTTCADWTKGLLVRNIPGIFLCHFNYLPRFIPPTNYLCFLFIVVFQLPNTVPTTWLRLNECFWTEFNVLILHWTRQRDDEVISPTTALLLLFRLLTEEKSPK